MTEHEAPIRLRDAPDGLPSELVTAMRGYEREGPSGPLRAQLRAALEAAIDAPPPPAPTIARTRWLQRPLGIASMLVALGSAWWASTPPSPPAAPTMPHAAPAPSIEVHAPEPSPPESSPPERAIEAPTPHAIATPRRRAARMRAPMPDPDAELALLRGARRALDSLPERSLALTDEHARRFAHGLFAQERELLAIEALMRRDDRGAAQRRAARFRKLYPASAHRERLDTLLGVDPR